MPTADPDGTKDFGNIDSLSRTTDGYQSKARGAAASSHQPRPHY